MDYCSSIQKRKASKAIKRAQSILKTLGNVMDLLLILISRILAVYAIEAHYSRRKNLCNLVLLSNLTQLIIHHVS